MHTALLGVGASEVCAHLRLPPAAPPHTGAASGLDTQPTGQLCARGPNATFFDRCSHLDSPPQAAAPQPGAFGTISGPRPARPSGQVRESCRCARPKCVRELQFLCSELEQQADEFLAAAAGFAPRCFAVQGVLLLWHRDVVVMVCCLLCQPRRRSCYFGGILSRFSHFSRLFSLHFGRPYKPVSRPSPQTSFQLFPRPLPLFRPPRPFHPVIRPFFLPTYLARLTR